MQTFQGLFASNSIRNIGMFPSNFEQYVSAFTRMCCLLQQVLCVDL